MCVTPGETSAGAEESWEAQRGLGDSRATKHWHTGLGTLRMGFPGILASIQGQAEISGQHPEISAAFASLTGVTSHLQGGPRHLFWDTGWVGAGPGA